MSAAVTGLVAAATPAPTVHVDIVLVNWNGRVDLLECLASLFRQDYPSFRVIVCDNASHDDSLDQAQQWADGTLEVAPQSAHFAPLFAQRPCRRPLRWVRHDRASAEHIAAGAAEPELVLIDTGGNLGFAGGNNVGLRYARALGQAAFVWVLNTDTIVAPDALAHLVARAQSDAGIGIVGSTLIHYWHPESIQATGGGSFDAATTSTKHLGAGLPVQGATLDRSAIEASTAYVIGASMLVSTAFLEQIGLMCEDYFLYFEELDWAIRGRGQFALAYSPQSLVYHKVGGSSSKVASVGASRYLYRSRLKFVARHFPQRFRPTLAVLFVEMLRHVAKGRFKQARIIWATLTSARELRQQGRSRAGYRWL